MLPQAQRLARRGPIGPRERLPLTRSVPPPVVRALALAVGSNRPAVNRKANENVRAPTASGSLLSCTTAVPRQSGLAEATTHSGEAHAENPSANGLFGLAATSHGGHISRYRCHSRTNPPCFTAVFSPRFVIRDYPAHPRPAMILWVAGSLLTLGGNHRGTFETPARTRAARLLMVARARRSIEKTRNRRAPAGRPGPLHLRRSIALSGRTMLQRGRVALDPPTIQGCARLGREVRACLGLQPNRPTTLQDHPM